MKRKFATAKESAMKTLSKVDSGDIAFVAGWLLTLAGAISTFGYGGMMIAGAILLLSVKPLKDWVI